MSVRKGMSILDLLPQTTGLAPQIPDGIVEQIGVLTILDHHSTTSPGFYLHEGTLQAVADALGINTANWALRIPGLTHGLPFRLAVQRPAAPAPLNGVPAATALAQEDVPALWTIDIEVWDVEILIPLVRAAKPVGGDGLNVPTLQATGTTDAQKRVYLCARGVLRISGGGPAGTQVQLVDAPDPMNPGAPSGAVVRMDLKPSSFLFGNSQYGMTIDKIVLDLSQNFTPAEIEARGHDEVWQGMSIKQATLFLPIKTPLVDNMTVGVRDLIIGNPFGMQGELGLDFGKDFADSLRGYLKVERMVDKNTTAEIQRTGPVTTDPKLEYALATGPKGAPQRVRAKFDIDNATIPGLKDMKVVGVWWEIPGGTEGNSATTPWFDAPTTAVMRYRLRIADASVIGPNPQPSLPSALPTGHTELVEVTVSFPPVLGSATGTAPLIDAVIGGVTYTNVLHLRGPLAWLEQVTLKTRPGQNLTDLVRWTLGSGSAPRVQPASATFSLKPMPANTPGVDLLISNFDGYRRIRIDVTKLGPLAIGHQGTIDPASKAMVTVHTVAGDVTPTQVTDTFLSHEFHVDGSHSSAPQAATINAANPAWVDVPQGADAEVEVPLPSGEFDSIQVIPAANPQWHVLQMTCKWDSDEPVRVVYPFDPQDSHNAATIVALGGKHDQIAWPLALDLENRAAPAGANVDQQIANWVNTVLPPLAAGQTRSFFVVGRTDDLWYASDQTTNTSENDKLATRRMNRAITGLTNAGVSAGSILYRIETGPAVNWPTVAQGAPERMLKQTRLSYLGSTADTGTTGAPVWRHGWAEDAVDIGSAQGKHALAKAFHERPPYRCAEIFVYDSGQPAQPQQINLEKIVLTRMLVPGADGALQQQVVATPQEGKADYRVRIKIKWDSPLAGGAGDYIPTLAEALVRWKAADITPPGGGGQTLPKPTGPDFWEVLLRWAYDASTGETEASGALSLPDGTLTWYSDFLAGALAFGPALSAKVDQSNVIQNQGVEFAACVGLFLVGGAIGSLINKDAGQGDKRSSVDIDKVAISYKWNGTPHVGATLDYTIDLHVNVSVNGAGSLKGHLRLAYKGVGLYFDGALGGGLQNFGLSYKDLAVQVVDPGTWSLGGPLGNLIRIAASRIGNGSQWMEYDLEFALDLGVVRLEGATIRAVLNPFGIEFRGLTASINIPSTLKGRGSVTIGDGGSFRALLALEVIPAKLSAYGALAIDQDFVSIEVGVQLPVGIPLGGTGFGIFGFMGRFVANGTRDLTPFNDPDPVQKNLDWYDASPEKKYKRLSGQFAFGVGAVIGTLPDGGFTFNAEGSLAIGFPDVSVIFAIDAHLISQRQGKAAAQGAKNQSSTRILGMVIIEPDSIMIGVRCNYVIPKVLELTIPFSAYFPLAGGNQGWYIRIGTDGDPTRPGAPVTLVLFPSILDVKAWAFVMIEEKQLHNLGGIHIPYWAHVGPLDFDGFSIGVGAGFDLQKSAGPFTLYVSAFLVVGVGTKPLLVAGAAGISASLDLGVGSIGIDGYLYFNVQAGRDPYAYGHFCGHINCLLFKVGGCVNIEIGNQPASNDAPEPDSPIAGMDLCDHLAAVKGKGALNGVDPLSTVWPDTVGVLKFNHYIEDTAGAQTDFVRKLASPAALTPWSGSTELKYAYRLKSVSLWKQVGANWQQVNGPFDSAWWLPTHRAAIIDGDPNPPPSTEEGRELGLWSLDPCAWSRWLTDDSSNVPGNPANTIENLCNPVQAAGPSCAYGKDREFSAGMLGAFKAKALPGVAFPSNFKVFAGLPNGLSVAVLMALGADAGWNWQQAAVVPLHGAVMHHGILVSAGWRFPEWRSKGKIVATAPIEFDIGKPLLEGEIVLEVCMDARQTTPTPTTPTPSTGSTLPATQPAILSLVSIKASEMPQVIATDNLGKTLVLSALALDMPAPTSTVVLPRCPKYVYRLPPKSDGTSWVRVDIAPWVNGDLALVAFCGTTMEAVKAQSDDTTFRASLIDLLKGLGKAVDNNQPTHQTYLDPDSVYEVRVAWQWQGWASKQQGDAPPVPLDASQWKDATKVDAFRFHTALFGLAAIPQPVQKTSLDQDPAQGGPGYDESTFDPRGIGRYVTHVQPTHEDPPHFLDDHIGFWFMVDHLPSLVAKYERQLQVKVLHTRPKIGSLADPALDNHVPGSLHVLDVTVQSGGNPHWQVDTSCWFESDAEMVVATQAAPCIKVTPATGSSTVSVQASLEPNSEYDLLLNTAPVVPGKYPEVAIARSHFRTSRYHNPSEMLHALGFDKTIGNAPLNDAITSGTLAAGALRMGDAELDQALKDLGMDPWPLPAAPRTTVIWQAGANNGPWQVAAVLVEADEPVWRAGNLTGAVNEPVPPPRLAVKSLRVFRTYDMQKQVGQFQMIWVAQRQMLGELVEQVRNGAGTRMLFRPSAPLAMGNDRLYDLELQFMENGNVGAVGVAPLFNRPTIIAQEI